MPSALTAMFTSTCGRIASNPSGAARTSGRASYRSGMPTHVRPPGALARDLRALGVVTGDALMVHASLRRIGPVEGGAEGVIDAILEAIGPQGTMLMVLGAADEWAWVNERSEAERPALLADAEPFDATTTPADPEVGALAEVFRRRPGTRVSDHPEGRFGAAGRLAERWLATVPWDDYFGPGSPLEELLQARGRVLRLGADPATTTLLHYAEYLAPIEPKRRVRRYRRVRTAWGSEVRVVDCLDDSTGSWITCRDGTTSLTSWRTTCPSGGPASDRSARPTASSSTPRTSLASAWIGWRPTWPALAG